MSTKKKKLISFLTAALLLVVTFFVIPFLTSEASAAALNQSQTSNFVVHTQQNNEYKSFISEQNLAKLKSSLEKSKMPKPEIYKEIYRELGYSNEEIDKIGIDEINHVMETSIAISVSQQYLSVDENGKISILSREECLNTANAINAKREADLQEKILQIQNGQVLSQGNNGITMDNDGSSETISNDGYMKITTRSDYVNPSTVNNQKGHYNFSATYEWLTTPSQSHTDAFSIYVADCAWMQGSADIYSKATYTWFRLVVHLGQSEESSGNIAQEKYIQDRQVQPTGIYYTYELPASYVIYDPDNYYFMSYSVRNLTYYVRARARVSNHTIPQSFNVFSRYEHLHKSVNISTSFEWSIGSWPGVSVTPSVGNNYTTYYSFNYTDYDPNFHMHTYRYSSNGLSSHEKYCSDCHYSINEGHRWSEFIDFFECIDCGERSKFIPIEITKLPSQLQRLLLDATINKETNISIDGLEYFYKDNQWYITK